MNDIEWLQQVAQSTSQLDIGRAHRHLARPGWSIKPRTIDDHILYYVISGVISATIGKQSQHWEAGQAAWVGPGIHQAAHNGGTGHLRFFTLRIRLTGGDGTLLEAPRPPMVVPAPMGLLAALDDIATAVRMPGRLAHARIRWRVADAFAQMLEANDGVGSTGGLSVDQRHRIQAWLHAHLAVDPQPADLAREADLSETAFRRRFRLSYGMSPRTWISHERLEWVADALLDSDESIGDIAADGGYQSVPSFTRLFTRRYGCSPRVWREKGDRRAQRLG